MGQYHKPFNLDKKQWFSPYSLACGLKLVEQIGGGAPGTGDALVLLLACSNGRGGGDVIESQDPHGLVGSWAGDRVAMVGDYSEPDDVPGFDVTQAYSGAGEDGDDEWTDISKQVAELLENVSEGVYVGDGWKDYRSLHRDGRCLECNQSFTGSHQVGDGRVLDCKSGHRTTVRAAMDALRTDAKVKG